MSSSPHVVPARFRFGRDPESDLAQPPVIHADELMLRRWYRLHDRGRTLARAELELLVQDMSAHPELWRHLLQQSPDERHYVRMLLDANVEIWLICWCATQETGFHDHGGSRGAVAVVQGMLSETLPNIGGEHPRALYRTGRLLLVRRLAHPRRPARRRRSGRVAARLLAAPGRDGLLRAGRRRHADAAAGRQRRGVLLTVRLRPPGWPPAPAPANRRAPAPR